MEEDGAHGCVRGEVARFHGLDEVLDFLCSNRMLLIIGQNEWIFFGRDISHNLDVLEALAGVRKLDGHLSEVGLVHKERRTVREGLLLHDEGVVEEVGGVTLEAEGLGSGDQIVIEFALKSLVCTNDILIHL